MENTNFFKHKPSISIKLYEMDKSLSKLARVAIGVFVRKYFIRMKPSELLIRNIKFIKAPVLGADFYTYHLYCDINRYIVQLNICDNIAKLKPEPLDDKIANFEIDKMKLIVIGTSYYPVLNRNIITVFVELEPLNLDSWKTRSENIHK